jgi:AraC-like DNA-binding protein/mannose-6-phosphate isomerase-like protein (cupin superfamily)
VDTTERRRFRQDGRATGLAGGRRAGRQRQGTRGADRAGGFLACGGQGARDTDRPGRWDWRAVAVSAILAPGAGREREGEGTLPNRKFESFKSDYLALHRQAELVFAGVLSDEHRWDGRQHEHVDSCEILLVVQGSGHTDIQGEGFAFGPGDLIIYNDRVSHTEHVSGRGDKLVFYYVVARGFSLENMEPNRLIPAGVSPVLKSGAETAALRSLYERIFEECESQDRGYEAAVNGLLQALLVRVIRIVNDQYQLLRSGTHENLGGKIRQYIERNYMRNLSLRDIARQFYISHYYLEHVFKEATGDSPISYLIGHRVEVAKKLLATTDLPVKAVAAMTGHNSLPYFCVTFRKATGVSATEYRRSVKGEKV